MNSRYNKKGLLIIITGVLLVFMALFLVNRISKYQTIKNTELLLEVLSEGEQIRLGDEDAEHTLVIFYDYSCTICRRFFHQTLPLLQTDIKDKKLSILLKPTNLNGDSSRSEAYQLLYCLNRYNLFQEIHEVLLIEPDYMYHSDFIMFQENLFQENIDIQHCIDDSNGGKTILENKETLNKLGFTSLPLYLYSNKAYRGHLSAEKIKSLIK